MNLLIYLYFVLNTMMCTEIHTVKLGSTKVQIIKTNGKKGKTFVHVHENEATALAAARLHVIRKGGTLITLRHKGTRNIVFNLKGRRYQFDPNRIFTDEGIKKTLHKYGPYSRGAFNEVKKLAKEILCLLPPGKIIAVHNNRDYSIKEYFPKHSLAADSSALYYRPNTSQRNFYFVTKGKEFKRLKRLQYNVALQSKNAQNDGSLSYCFSSKNYINIEAAYGALNVQLKMLRSA